MILEKRSVKLLQRMKVVSSFIHNLGIDEECDTMHVYIPKDWHYRGLCLPICNHTLNHGNTNLHSALELLVSNVSFFFFG